MCMSVVDAFWTCYTKSNNLPRCEKIFFPWLCTVQYQRVKRTRYGQKLNSSNSLTSQRLSLQHSTLLPLMSTLEHDDLANLKIGVIVHRCEVESAIRVNTLHNFYEINKRLLSGVAYNWPLDPKDRSLIDQRAQISSDTIIGDSTQVSERTTIKRSVIGRHCIIGKMVKISGCVLLDHCIIEDGAKLDRCILGKNTQVGSKVELSRCITQAGYEINAGEVVKGEKLEVSDWTANPEDGSSLNQERFEDNKFLS